jgi:hypothetical protein
MKEAMVTSNNLTPFQVMDRIVNQKLLGGRKPTRYHRWASALRKLTLAWAFRHPSSQSGTGAKKCRTVMTDVGMPMLYAFMLYKKMLYSGTKPASLVFFNR